MTLDTRIRAKGPVDARAVHDWANRELLQAENPIIDDSGRTIANAPGQGFDAWLITTHNNGRPFEFDGLSSDSWYAEHPEELEEDRARFKAEPVGYVELSFDTAYAFRDAQGRGCSDLHAWYVVRLAEYFAGFGVEIAWRNEYTYEWHDGTDGLEEFARNGAEAKAWFHEVALPAIAARLANGSDQ